MLHAPIRFRAAGITLAAIAIAALGSTSADAAITSSAGTIGVSLNVTAACAVNGATSVTAALGPVGTIAFPDQPGIFGDTDASLVATGGGSAISVLCSPGLTPTMLIGGGANATGGLRHLASGSNQVGYKLYSDLARLNEITVGGTLSLGTATTTAFSVPIYARVNSNGVALPAGAYADTVQVTLSW